MCHVCQFLKYVVGMCDSQYFGPHKSDVNAHLPRKMNVVTTH
jgi:hypothetical protein